MGSTHRFKRKKPLPISRKAAFLWVSRFLIAGKTEIKNLRTRYTT